MTAEMDASQTPAALPFLKMHGLGNDFVVFDARRRATREDAAFLRAVADRRRGVGCDTVVIVDRSEEIEAAARVRFFNADGTEAGACGNATRCVADRLMSERGLVALRLETRNGLLPCRRAEGGLIRVDMGPPELDWRRIPLAEASDTIRIDVKLGPIDAPSLWGPSAVNMGNPHAVFFVEDAEAQPIETLGPMIEHHPMFPERANVEFAQTLDRETVRLRVWERGVGVTQACGSGACAAVVAGVRRGLTERRCLVRLDGGDLEIAWSETDDHVYMTGPTALAFEGTLDAAALMREANDG